MYIKRSSGKYLLYKKYEYLRIESFLDSNYAIVKREKNLLLTTAIGGNLVTSRSKMQSVVYRSSAEAKYKVITHIICEMMRLKFLL